MRYDEPTRSATAPRLRTLVLERPAPPAPAPIVAPVCRPRATRRRGGGRPRSRRAYGCQRR